jgi:apolipoprotein N-acyltransferase
VKIGPSATAVLLKKAITSPLMRGKPQLFLLALLSAALLSIAWYAHLSITAFFGFVPLLFIEEKIFRENPGRGRLQLFFYSFLAFLIWNVSVTWWVVYASFGGACMAFIFNSMLMAIVFVVFSVISRSLSRQQSAWLLLPVWIAWEHLHTIWDISWTWLTLGNIFAFNHNWIQWYEFTGTSGGSLWILAVNVLVFQTMMRYKNLQLFSIPLLRIALSIILPVLLSFLLVLIRMKDPITGPPVPVVVVQPNIDPYGEKFSLDYKVQFLRALELIHGQIDERTQYLVLPETFITDDINEELIEESDAVRWFRDTLLRRFPQLKIVAGGNTYMFYDKGKITATARRDRQSGKYYDIFNTAVYISNSSAEVYHKSKLVPGVERMPFPALLRPLEQYAINLGGTMGSLGTQEERTVFRDPVSGNIVAPVICYESVYADYTTEYIRNGANLIFIITNDGWWDDTPGYIQHLNIGKLRAIENRRQIARSANTGISCFIDAYGNISQATSWWQEAVIKKDLYRNDKLTFFSWAGDLISYFSVIVTLLMIGLSAFLKLKKYRSVQPGPELP